MLSLLVLFFFYGFPLLDRLTDGDIRRESACHGWNDWVAGHNRRLNRYDELMAFALSDTSTIYDLSTASGQLSQLANDQAASDPPEAAKALNGNVVLAFRITADLAESVAAGDFHPVEQSELQLDRLFTGINRDTDAINARCRS